jgi:hypothetical protein
MPREVGTLHIDSVPQGATVYINNERQKSKTPVRLFEIAAGEYSVRIELEGYKEWEEDIVVNPNEYKSIKAELVPLEEVAKVPEEEILEGLPPLPPLPPLEEKVVEKEKRPEKEPVQELQRQVKKEKEPQVEKKVEKPKKKPTVKKVKKKPKKKVVRKPGRPKPAVLTGNIFLTSDPTGADVFLGGTYKGKTPLSIKRVKAWVPHEITVKYPGYEIWCSRLFTDPNQTTQMHVMLEKKKPITSELFEETCVYITSIPPYAKVYIDNEEKGLTPLRGIKISEGEHFIKVVKEGYRRGEKKVMITKGVNFVNFELKVAR